MKTRMIALMVLIAVMVVSVAAPVFAADTTISGSACSIRYWDSPTSLPESLRYIWSIESRFYANKLTDGRVKTVAKRNIKQSYIELYETRNGQRAGKAVSTKSTAAPSKTYASQIYTFLSMVDSPDWDLKTNVDWNWYYF